MEANDESFGLILGMWFRNLGRVKKKVLHSQYFYNKSQLISYYLFKFEFNTEIIFLIQQ